MDDGQTMIKDEPSQAEQTNDDGNQEDISTTLLRLTSGLPKRELRLMEQEAHECEALLLEDIRILEEALNDATPNTSRESQSKNESQTSDDSAALNMILESPLTPLDRFWTASALLGRLRHEMSLPSLHTPRGVKASTIQQSAAADEKTFRKLNSPDHPLAKIYSKDLIPLATLLAVWKKISSHRAAAVFKRPVRSEEAPGYSERIMFPMELSLIRKRIVAGNIQTYADLHGALGLISHNCVKYNGRETDYGRAARDFEAMADSAILQAIRLAAEYTIRSAATDNTSQVDSTSDQQSSRAYAVNRDPVVSETVERQHNSTSSTASTSVK